VRRRNLIPPDKLPYVTQIVTRDGLPMTYDSGDYVGASAGRCGLGWTDFPARREARSARAACSGSGLRTMSKAPAAVRSKAPPCASGRPARSSS
jgi:carbon-monoxide dehydrogenase large subunit